VQAANTGAEANLDGFKAGSAMAALPYGMCSSLLGGARSLLDAKWPSFDSGVSNYIPKTNITYADGLAQGIIPV